MRVVIVDDMPDVRKLVRTALRVHGGFEVVGEAGDGSEAVRLADELQPDIVVLDLGLPDIAGREILGQVREHAPRAKIVVFSAADADRDWVSARADGFVLKDSAIDYLVDLLSRLGPSQGRTVTFSVPQDLSQLAGMRRFVRATLRGWEVTDLVDDAALVASELVANAITHARSAPELMLALLDDRVRIEVIDQGTGTPDPRPSSHTSERGRGIYLVNALSTAWGTAVVDADRKVVWAELTTRLGT